MTPEERARWNNLIGIMPRGEFDLVLKVLKDVRAQAYEEAENVAAKNGSPGMMLERFADDYVRGWLAAVHAIVKDIGELKP